MRTVGFPWTATDGPGRWAFPGLICAAESAWRADGDLVRAAARLNLSGLAAGPGAGGQTGRAGDERYTSGIGQVYARRIEEILSGTPALHRRRVGYVMTVKANMSAVRRQLRKLPWKAVSTALSRRPGGLARGLHARSRGGLIAWPQDSVFLPLTDTAVAGTTGAGDAFTAALIAALAQGKGLRQAAAWRSTRPAPPSVIPAAGPR